MVWRMEKGQGLGMKCWLTSFEDMDVDVVVMCK